MPIYLIGMAVMAVFTLITLLCAMSWRIVVPTNAVHIVQSGRKTTPYGAGQAKNIYYRWPSWIPTLGVQVSILPLSVFRVELENYAAYDKGRLPFMLDVLAFFRICDPARAAERISSINELDGQLQGIMQGVVRTILANAEIEDILGKRAEFSEAFTKEIKEQLPQWGIEAVKSVELMDIRDANDSQVIKNIMAKKKSEIEKESRVTVAENMQAAKTAEINANQTVSIREQESQEQIGIRTATKDQAIGIRTQQSKQAVAAESRTTAEAEMAVTQVNSVRAAEIDKQVMMVRAERDKAVEITNAEAEKQKVTINAEGTKAAAVTAAEGRSEAMKLEAVGIEAKGKAEGAAETAKLMAPVTTQLTLAEKIGENKSYQEYLIQIRQVDAVQAVGVEQAKALAEAEIKIVATGGDPGTALNNVRDLFTAKGGAMLGAMLQGFKATEAGGKVIDAIAGETK